MAFNELNSVEHYIIHRMSGHNLNSGSISEPNPEYGIRWEYKAPQELDRAVNEVMLELS